MFNISCLKQIAALDLLCNSVSRIEFNCIERLHTFNSAQAVQIRDLNLTTDLVLKFIQGWQNLNFGLISVHEILNCLSSLEKCLYLKSC